MSRFVPQHWFGRALLFLPLAVGASGWWGCVAALPATYRADRYYIEAQLTPAEHRLIGRAELDLASVGPLPGPEDCPISFEVLLHPDLKVHSIVASGGTVKGWRALPPEKDKNSETSKLRKYMVTLDSAVESLTLNVSYSGVLVQDPSAGEKPGQIHNFEMRAHIGLDGIYLSDGCWYPRPEAMRGTAPLADFTLVARSDPEFDLVAGADPDPRLSEEIGGSAWRSPYPLSELVLVGGRHDVYQREHAGVTIELHLKPSQAGQVEGLFSAVTKYLDRYEPMIGKYPASHYAIVDNFFSSGFAFPTFTLLSSAVIDMGERAQSTHGYLDHEMLHSWWGNGIMVDPDDGNWCEALASYGANYYGYILDGNADEARRKRRNYSHFLSRLEPDKDKPLGSYGQEGGCGRGVAYDKGAAVFHMLARKIGQDRFWAAMRRFTSEFVGKYASWEDIRRLCEEESGVSLRTFFRQWVRSGGAPRVRIEHARYDSADQSLTIGLAQDEPAFDVEVPVRVAHEGGSVDLDLRLNSLQQELTVPIDVSPLTVELDPDYHLFRKVPLADIVPTTASTRYGHSFVSILPDGEVPDRFETARSMFEQSFKDDEVRTLSASELGEGDLAESCVLILGDAVRNASVAAFLSAVEFPVRWTDKGFLFENQMYVAPEDAILCTVAHPGVPGGGVTVLYANSVEAIPSPISLLFYDRSVVVFSNAKPILRRDLEHRTVIQVDRS